MMNKLTGDWNVIVYRRSQGDGWMNFGPLTAINNDDLADLGADVAAGDLEVRVIASDIPSEFAKLFEAAPEMRNVLDDILSTGMHFDNARNRALKIIKGLAI